MFLEDEIKRKLRRMKRLEINLRFGGKPPAKERLVWTRFFSSGGKYPPGSLDNEKGRKEAQEEFLFTLYYQYYSERGLLEGTFDPIKLDDLGLPPDASSAQVKARFRELAKQYHPDLGGSDAKMIRLLKIYRRLM